MSTETKQINIVGIEYDENDGRITKCSLSIGEKNHEVKWTNGRYMVSDGGSASSSSTTTAASSSTTTTTTTPASSSSTTAASNSSTTPAAGQGQGKTHLGGTFNNNAELTEQLKNILSAGGSKFEVL